MRPLWVSSGIPPSGSRVEGEAAICNVGVMRTERLHELDCVLAFCLPWLDTPLYTSVAKASYMLTPDSRRWPPDPLLLWAQHFIGLTHVILTRGW